jgi:rod shape-determining protein MreC
VQVAAFSVFARLQRVLAAVSDGAHTFWQGYVALHVAVRENEELKRRNLELEGELQRAQARSSEVKSLEQALGLREEVEAPMLPARVIAGDPKPGSLTITIDQGAADGVEPDMAVVGPRGVVGRVINKPLPHASQVQLIVGRNAAAAVVFERTSVGGIAIGGQGDPPIRVDWVSNAADIKPGDRVLTSGLDSLFPRGFLVGNVERAERHAGTWTIAVRPAVDFSHLDLVLVVLEKRAPMARSGSS